MLSKANNQEDFDCVEEQDELEDYMEKQLMAEAQEMGVFEDAQDPYSDALKKINEAVS